MNSLFIIGMLVATAVAGQDWAKQAVEKSPRHREWVNVKSGNRTRLKVKRWSRDTVDVTEAA